MRWKKSALVGKTRVVLRAAAIGRVGVSLSPTANVRAQSISLRVYFRARQGGVSMLEQLYEDRDAIERELGMELEWNPNPNAKDKIVRVRRKVDFAKRAQWENHMDWLVESIEQFLKVFGPRIRELELDAESGDEE